MEPAADAPPPPEGNRSKNAVAGRVALAVACLALATSAVFSIGEVRAAAHKNHQPNPAVSAGALSGLSISRLRQLQTQVQQAAALAQNANPAVPDDLSQLEQQLGISPSSSLAGAADQLQAELDAINACLGGSGNDVPPGC